MHRRTTPAGMTRRHFMQHVASASAMASSAAMLTSAVEANADDLRRRHKAAILLWMSGGPSTMDIWDLKPGQSTGGPFRPISTSGDVQICEHMPKMAEQMHHMAIVRSMSTREADHQRGRYYMHTGYVPNPNIEHPSYGAVIAHELSGGVPELQIPPFISIGGGSEGPGFLGMGYAPFVVQSNGQVRNLNFAGDPSRMSNRMQMLDAIENRFASQRRGELPSDHQKILAKTKMLMTSNQMEAFKVESEPQAIRDRYGDSGFGRGCLMARRLVEQGVPFVEVDFGGWDNHQNIFPTLETRLPDLDRGMSALVEDLAQRGMLDDTVVIWMGEFSRTPRINGNGGRDHWARSWSTVVGGGGIQGGVAIGETSADGTAVETDPYTSQDLMATVLKSLGVSLDVTYTSKNNRPMKIANSGRVIKELFA